MRKMRLHRVPFATLAVIACTASGSALAQNATEWTAANGGDFHNPANWSDGVPDVDSTAVFDTVSGADVLFSQSGESHRLFIHSGAVSFHLNGSSLSLNAPFVWSPSLVIAEEPGDSASLELLGGQVTGTFAVLGDSNGSYGSLRLEDAELELTAHAFIGLGGSGLLELSQESLMSAPAFTLGSLDGSIGEVAINGGSRMETWGPARIAQLLGSNGNATVTGQGAEWEIYGSLDVGIRGHGAVHIAQGAHVMVHGSVYAGVLIGHPVHRAELIVDGVGSLLEIDQDLWLGPETGSSPFPWNGKLGVRNGGRAEIAGELVQVGSLGKLEVGIGSSTQYQHEPALAFGSSASIPIIEVLLLNGFVPSSGDIFRIVAHPAASLTLPSLPDPLGWNVVEKGDEVVIQVTGPVNADLNNDGVVNIFDLLILLGQWGPCPQGDACTADLNLDGFVNVFDLLLLLGNWG